MGVSLASPLQQPFPRQEATELATGAEIKVLDMQSCAVARDSRLNLPCVDEDAESIERKMR